MPISFRILSSNPTLRPRLACEITPEGVMKFADFMHRVGTIRSKPQSWKDLFFPAIHDLPGS